MVKRGLKDETAKKFLYDNQLKLRLSQEKEDATSRTKHNKTSYNNNNNNNNISLFA